MTDSAKKYKPVNRAAVSNKDYTPQNRALLLPYKEPTLGSKAGAFGKEMVKAIVKPAATIAIGRPAQLLARTAGASDEHINRRTKEVFGDWIAPTPQNASDVVKDVGRGIQTALMGGLGGTAKAGYSALASKGVKPTLSTLAGRGAIEGAGFGFGAALEEGGAETTARDAAKMTALGGVFGGAIPVAGAGLSKVFGKGATKVAPKAESNIIYSGQPVGGAVKETTHYTPSKSLAEEYAKLNKNVTGKSSVIEYDLTGKKIKDITQAESIKMSENPKLWGDADVLRFTVKGERQPTYIIKSGTKAVKEPVNRAATKAVTRETPTTAPVQTLSKEVDDDIIKNVTNDPNIPITERQTNIEQQRIAMTQGMDTIEDTVFGGASKSNIPEGTNIGAYRAILYNEADRLSALGDNRLANKLLNSTAERNIVREAGQTVQSQRIIEQGNIVNRIGKALSDAEDALPKAIRNRKDTELAKFETQIKKIFKEVSDAPMSRKQVSELIDSIIC